MRSKNLITAFLIGILTTGTLVAQNEDAARRERWEQRRRNRQSQENRSFSPLELHGMIGSGENLEVSIKNPETGESQWVKLRDKKAKWYVESANPLARSVVVRLNGMALKLDLTANTGEPMSIAPQPTPLSADEVAAEANKGRIIVNGLDAKQAVARMIEMRKTGQRPTQKEMQEFGNAIRQLTPEQRTQYFTEIRTEVEKSGINFGPPGGRGGNRGGNADDAGNSGNGRGR